MFFVHIISWKTEYRGLEWELNYEIMKAFLLDLSVVVFYGARNVCTTAKKQDLTRKYLILNENSLSMQEVERITIQALVHLSQLISMLFRALSPNILISLIYRMGVLMAVSYIAPSLNIGNDSTTISSSNGNSFSIRKSSRDEDFMEDDEDNAGRAVPWLASLAKPVLLMTHTRVLLQHFGYLKPTLAIWGWLNAFLCLALFAAELVLAREDAWDHYRSD